MLEEKDIKLIEKMISDSITSIIEAKTEKESEHCAKQESIPHEEMLPQESLSRIAAYEKVLSKREGEKRKAKVIFAMSGGKASKGSQTTRITLPITWVREMGISPDAREVTITYQDNKIIIEKPE